MPEVSICHNFGSTVKSMEVTSDFCETGCKSEHKCVYSINNILTPTLHEMKKHFKNKDFDFPTGQCSLSHIQKDSRMVSSQFSQVFEQEFAAPIITQSQPNRLQCMVHIETEACFLSHKTVGVLKLSLVKAWVKILHVLHVTVNIFRRQIQRVIEVQEDHIKN